MEANFLQSYQLDWYNQTLQLLPQKAIFWKEKKMLVLGDLHLGKASHFRKEGLPVPDTIIHADLKNLSALLTQLPIQQVVFLGDLFHSSFNHEWRIFSEFVSQFPELKFVLVKGNHDVLTEFRYTYAGIDVVDELYEEPFYFSHESHASNNEAYRFTAHIHPAVRLTSPNMPSLRIPCFYFGKNEAVLPAFGKFTGLHIINPVMEDLVFGISGDKVLRLPVV